MLLQSKPGFTEKEALSIALKMYGINGKVKVLEGERDQNFLLESTDGEKYVLKIANPDESRDFLEAEIEMINLLGRGNCRVPSVIKNVKGENISETSSPDGTGYMVWMVTFIDGKPAGRLGYYSEGLLYDIGCEIAKADSILAGFNKDIFKRRFDWDLRIFPSVIEKYGSYVTDSELSCFIMETLELYNGRVKPLSGTLRESIIHNDANDYNIIVERDNVKGNKLSLAGIIDFGDSVWSWTVANLAVAIAYCILDKPEPLPVAASLVRGYNDTFRLLPEETEVLFALVRMRLSVSICMAAYQQVQRPGDEYLGISQEPIRRTISRIAKIDPDLAEAWFRLVCRFAPNENIEEVNRFIEHSGEEAFPVLGYDLTEENCMLLDLGVEGDIISGDERLNSEQYLSARITETIRLNKAVVGIGRYDEPRILYTSPLFGSSAFTEKEERTIHLGIDLFVEAGSPLYSPFDAVVYAFASNPSPLDYGNVIILEHKAGEGRKFYTLYGHLSNESLPGISSGQRISAGERFASTGSPAENGGWTPHLHFQVISDIGAVDCDFPGVCTSIEREAWKVLSPDPAPMLRIPSSVSPVSIVSEEDTLERRRELLGKSLSIGYNRHIKMARGYMQYMFDHNGLKYLDGYNNVPHIGHCHPEVTEVAASQMRKLNTNTRYLNDSINDFAGLLLSTFPAKLNRCFFLNSGSEANELALRLAFTYTGNRDMLVLEGAYHGNTNTMIDISPYKHDGPGGMGTPPWVHKLPVPDCYRGRYRYDDPEAGIKYAAMAAELIRKLDSEGKKVAAFIAETCPSVGGQIIFPRDYLGELYRHVRNAGGLCIADEVQTAYGRMGTSFYAFQDQGVVPDIVVLGKPIGNGHPVAAVITTSDIAAAFDNGMEFFSTFGGNNVSCKVGYKVLEITLRDKLQDHALKTGSYLLKRLHSLRDRYPLIGDVRGSGLFTGIELVRPGERLEPAAEEASWISNRLRDNRILIGTDGPYHNVLKIRPPMPFTIENADILCDRLDGIFREQQLSGN